MMLADTPRMIVTGIGKSAAHFIADLRTKEASYSGLQLVDANILLQAQNETLSSWGGENLLVFVGQSDGEEGKKFTSLLEAVKALSQPNAPLENALKIAIITGGDNSQTVPDFSDLVIVPSSRDEEVVASNVLCLLADLLMSSSLSSIDFDDVMALFKNGGIASIGHGEGDGKNAVADATSMALGNIFPNKENKNLKGAKSVLIGIFANVGIMETQETIQVICSQCSDDVAFVWGYQASDDDEARVFIIGC